ncbi:MAG: hypothetical protein WCG19_03670 [Chlorobiaceae bacterium]
MAATGESSVGRLVQTAAGLKKIRSRAKDRTGPLWQCLTIEEKKVP